MRIGAVRWLNNRRAAAMIFSVARVVAVLGECIEKSPADEDT
jgi:hypothetical protein